MKAQIVDLSNQAVGEIDLADEVFSLEPRKDLLARMVNYQLAKRRAGTHKTKGVSEISGTTKKPFRQKGTGRARQGSSRASQMRGGQTVFGPVVRSHAHDLPKKVRKLALKTALSTKAKAGQLIILDDAKVETPKTAALVKQFSALGLGSALIVGGSEVDANFQKAAANIPRIDVLPEQGANVYDILRRDTLVLTKSAVEALEARLK